LNQAVKLLPSQQLSETENSSLVLKFRHRDRFHCWMKGLAAKVNWRNDIFYILLTMHHVMILGQWPTLRTILFYVFIYIFNSLHVSSTSCSSSGETNCVNTASGSCHSVSVAVSCAGRKFTDTEWQLPEAVLTQFVSPDDEHDVLETCRELKIKINT